MWQAIIPAVASVAGAAISGKGSSSQISNDPWEGVRDNLRNLYAGVESAYGNALPYYPSETFAPFNALDIGGMHSALDYTQNRFLPGVGALQGALSGHVNMQANPGANPYAAHYQHMFNSPMDVPSNPQLNALKMANQSQVMDSFLRQAMPGIRAGAQMAGQYGGSREALASGVAMGDAAESLANANAAADMQAWDRAMQQQSTGAQLMDSTFRGGLNASLDAMRQAPNVLQLGFMGPDMAMRIGEMQRGQHQRAIDDQMARYYYPEERTWEMLSNMSGIYSGASPYNSTTSRLPGNPMGGAVAGGLLGNAIGNWWNQGSTPSLNIAGPVGGGTIYNSGGGYDYLMGY